MSDFAADMFRGTWKKWASQHPGKTAQPFCRCHDQFERSSLRGRWHKFDLREEKPGLAQTAANMPMHVSKSNGTSCNIYHLPKNMHWFRSRGKQNPSEPTPFTCLLAMRRNKVSKPANPNLTALRTNPLPLHKNVQSPKISMVAGCLACI